MTVSFQELHGRGVLEWPKKKYPCLEDMHGLPDNSVEGAIPNHVIVDCLLNTSWREIPAEICVHESGLKTDGDAIHLLLFSPDADGLALVISNDETKLGSFTLSLLKHTAVGNDLRLFGATHALHVQAHAAVIHDRCELLITAACGKGAMIAFNAGMPQVISLLLGGRD